MNGKAFKMPEGIKIAKYLADCGLGSRRKCENLVASGKVRINGSVVKNVAERIDPESDVVEFAGRKISPIKSVVFALNKPAGYVSTMADPHAALTIADLIPAKYASLGLKPVGRLDKDSEGLMILTNDGMLTNRLMHPRYGIGKIYRVSLDSPVQDRIIGLLKKGIRLPDGEKLQPWNIRMIGKGRNKSQELEITLSEGKKREIRRALEMFGHQVIKLRRVAIGPIKLGVIRKGQLVKLTEHQVKMLMDACKL